MFECPESVRVPSRSRVLSYSRLQVTSEIATVKGIKGSGALRYNGKRAQTRSADLVPKPLHIVYCPEPTGQARNTS